MSAVETTGRLGRPDAIARRILSIPQGPPRLSSVQAQRSFSAAMVLSGLRCLFSYVLVPVVLPVLGVAAGAAPAIGAPLAAVAIVFDVRGIRRFFLANSPHRWSMAAIYLAVMVLVIFLFVRDVVTLAR